MAQQKENSIGIIISIAVALLLGVILITIIAQQTVTKTQVGATYTDTVNLAALRGSDGEYNYTLAESNKLYAQSILRYPASGDWKTDFSECAIATIVVKNASGSIASNANDYTWVQDGNGINGWLRVKNSTTGTVLGASSSNISTITYTTCPQDYVASSWARTVLNLVPGFFVLALLLGAAFVILYILRNEGIEMNI